jgi:hypothetical protein
MRKLACAAGAFVFAAIAPLPAIAYSQADVDACTPDVMRLCLSAIPDATRVTLCLAQNKRQLSPACTVVFNRPRGASADQERPRAIQNTNF